MSEENEAMIERMQGNLMGYKGLSDSEKSILHECAKWVEFMSCNGSWVKNGKVGFSPNDILRISPDYNPEQSETPTESHLEWIYQRMIRVHGEDKNVDYMVKFKELVQMSKELSK